MPDEHGGGHGGHGDAEEESRVYVGPKVEKSLFDLVLSSLHGVSCGALGVENKVEGGHGHGHGHGSEHSHDAHAQHVAEEAHQDATQVWFGLFTDLIFVAVIVQFANQFKGYFKGFYITAKGDPDGIPEFYTPEFTNECKALYKMGAKKPYFSSSGYECIKEGGGQDFQILLGQAFLYFYAFWICWLELTCTLARFINIEGLIDDFLYMVYLLGIVVMSVQMDAQELLFKNIAPFACGLAVSMMAMCFLHIFFVIKAPECRDYAYRRIFGYLVSSVLFVVSALLPGVKIGIPEEERDATASAILLCIGLTIILWISLTSFMVQADCMNTMEYFTERFGILVMIVTGESILALILGDTSDPTDTFKNSSLDYQTVYISFAIMYIVKNIYFQSHAEEEYHALNEPGFPGACLWVFLHLPLTFFLLGCGVGFKLMFTQLYADNGEPTLEVDYALVMGMSLTGVVITMLFIRTAHRKYILQHWVTYATRVPTLVLIPMGVWICDSVIPYLTWCLALVFVSYCWDLTILDKWEIEKEVKDLKTKAELQLAKERNEKVQKIQEADGDNAANKGICRKSIGNCLRSIPSCDSDEYANWEQAGFNGPPDEIPPYYLPYDVVCCITENGYKRVTEEVAPGKTGMLHDLHALHEQDHEAAHHEESNKDWLGEFTDLIFVAIIIKFAEQIKYSTKYGKKMQYPPTMKQIIGESILFYSGFFAVWLEMTCEFIRFKNMPGVFDDLLRFFYLLGIVTMALQIETAKYMTENAKGYMWGYLVCIFTQLIVHTIYYARLDRAERYARWRIMTYAVSCIALVVGVIVTSGIDKEKHPAGAADHPAYAEIVAIISCVSAFIIFVSVNSFRVAFLPQLSSNGKIKWKPDPHHGMVMEKPTAGRAPEDDEEFIERFGLLVMITTGESVLALIVGASDVFEQESRFYVVVIMAYIVMFYLKNLYFTSSQLKLHDGHALLEKDIPGGVCWVLCHGVLAYLLLSAGVGFKLIFATMADDDTAASDPKYKKNFTIYTNVLCLSVAMAVVMILFIRLAHDKFIWSFATGPVRILPVVMIACSSVIFATDDMMANDWVQAYICIWLFVWIVFLDVYDYFVLSSFDKKFRYLEVAMDKYDSDNEETAHGGGHGHGSTEMAEHGHGASKGGIQGDH